MPNSESLDLIVPPGVQYITQVSLIYWILLAGTEHQRPGRNQGGCQLLLQLLSAIFFLAFSSLHISFWSFSDQLQMCYPANVLSCKCATDQGLVPRDQLEHQRTLREQVNEGLGLTIMAGQLRTNAEVDQVVGRLERYHGR